MAAISLGELPQLSATLLATSAARAHAKVAIRLLASIASVGVFAMTSSAIQQLGKQFHFMGVRVHTINLSYPNNTNLDTRETTTNRVHRSILCRSSPSVQVCS